jgi:hypothetical protein
MKQNSVASIVVLFSLFLFGCTKKDEAPNQTAQLASILTAKSWKLSSTVMISTSGNINQTIQSCKLDDLWEYNSSGKFAKFPGTNKCSSSDLTVLGTWEIVDNNKGLKVTLSSGGTYTDEIILLDNSKLQLKFITGTAAYIDTYIPN